MLTFIMTAAAAPKKSNTWFSGFVEGSMFEAADQDSAQDYLNQRCENTGTSTDPEYLRNGPYAKLVSVRSYKVENPQNPSQVFESKPVHLGTDADEIVFNEALAKAAEWGASHINALDEDKQIVDVIDKPDYGWLD